MSKFLITGGAGFIGSHIARRLLSLGHEVWVVDNLTTGYLENVPPGSTFVQLDLSRPEAFDNLPEVPFDAVLHLAAQSSGEISFEKPVYDLQTNMLGTLLLLHWCYQRGIRRFLYASSMSIYGDVGDEAVDETHPCQPKSFYGIGKLAAERYLHIFSEKGMRTTAFRMFNVYGPGQNLANLKQGMVSIYLAYILKGEPILVKGSRDRFRDFIYIDDVVNAWVAAIESSNTFGKTYNLASGKKTFVWELLEELIKAFGYDPSTYPVEFATGTLGDQFGIWADIRRIKADLDWQPHTSLLTGLRKMVKWGLSQV